MNERAADKAEAWQKNCMAILGNGEIAVCIKPGPWHGWLFKKHPDSQWVSVGKLPTGPMTPEGHPLAVLAATPSQGERAGLSASEIDTLKTLLVYPKAALAHWSLQGDQKEAAAAKKDYDALVSIIRRLAPTPPHSPDGERE